MGDKDDRDTPHEARPLGEWGPFGRDRNGGDFDNGLNGFTDDQLAAFSESPRFRLWANTRRIQGSVPPEALERPPYPQGGFGRYGVPFSDRLVGPLREEHLREVSALLVHMAGHALSNMRRHPTGPVWNEFGKLDAAHTSYELSLSVRDLSVTLSAPITPRPAGDAMRPEDV